MSEETKASLIHFDGDFSQEITMGYYLCIPASEAREFLENVISIASHDRRMRKFEATARALLSKLPDEEK